MSARSQLTDYFSLGSRPSPSVQTGKAWNPGYDYLLPNSQGDMAKHCWHYSPENPYPQRSRRNPSQEHDARFSQNLSINKSNRTYPVKAPFALVHVYQTHKETCARTIFLRIHATDALFSKAVYLATNQLGNSLRSYPTEIIELECGLEA